MKLTDAQLAQCRAEIGKGREIANLIENETVKGILNGMLHGYQNRWLITETAEARELLWQKALGIQEFIDALKSIIDTGKMANHQLEQDRKVRGQNDES